MTLPATIYARFSNAEQAQGSSKARQLTLCRDMVARHGWDISPDRELVDEGLSAYSGANRAAGGHLFTFEQRVEAGLYRNGHVLVVENLDRISRQGYDAILPFLQKLTSQGVTVATVDGDRVYAAFERVSMTSVIEAVVKSELSREESEKKSRRLKAAQNKRVSEAQANAGKYISHTATVPAWINVERISKPTERPVYRMTLNEKRIAVLCEIFQLTIDGFGTPAIAKILNGRGEPVWTHLNVKSANGWTVGYLTKIVLNRAVLGEYNPMNRPRTGPATSKDVKILNHFPQAIDPVMFAKAAAARESRKGTSGAWQITHNNLFSGIAKCSECGGRMKQEITVHKGGNRRNGKNRDAVYQSKQSISYLKCHNALNNVWDEERGQLRCTNRNWVRYEKLESAVVRIAVGWMAVHRQGAPSADVAELEVQIAEARRFLEDKRMQAENAAESFVRTQSPTMERMMLRLEAEVAEDQKAILALEARLTALRSSAPSPEFMEQMEEQRRALDSEDEDERNRARVMMKQTLGRMITKMLCQPSRFTTVVFGGSLKVVFDNEGNELANGFTEETIYLGPNGEIDWHPDFPNRNYEIHPSAR